MIKRRQLLLILSYASIHLPWLFYSEPKEVVSVCRQSVPSPDDAIIWLAVWRQSTLISISFLDPPHHDIKVCDTDNACHTWALLWWGCLKKKRYVKCPLPLSIIDFNHDATAKSRAQTRGVGWRSAITIPYSLSFCPVYRVVQKVRTGLVFASNFVKS